MKKFLAILLCMMCLVTSFICVSAESDTKIKVDGEVVSLVAYNIYDNNYFKLRDIANILKGTDAHFDVLWNAEAGAIELVPDCDYSTEEQLTTEKFENPEIVKSNAKIFKNNNIVLLDAYNINGNTFFKLRDLANVIDFGVNWIAEEGIIEINSSENYTHPEYYGDGLALNPEILSLFNKDKKYIDEHYSFESTGYNAEDYIYDSYQFTATYNAPVTEESSVYKLEMTVQKLIYNCKDKMTSGEIAALFSESKSGIDKNNNVAYLIANYCGYELTFWYAPGGTISKHDSVSIDLNNPYISEIKPQTPAVSYPLCGEWYSEKYNTTICITSENGEDYEVSSTRDGVESSIRNVTKLSETQLSFEMFAGTTYTRRVVTLADNGQEILVQYHHQGVTMDPVSYSKIK